MTEPIDHTNQSLKICGYGKYGAKKTLQAGHLIEEFGAANVLVVSADAGLATIESRLTAPGNVIAVSSMSDLRACHKRMAAMTRDQWVVIDGGSEIHGWVASDEFEGVDRYYELSSTGASRTQIPAEVRQYGRFITSGGDIDSQKVYGEIGRVCKRMLSSWKALTANVYVTYLEDMTGTNDRRMKVLPYGPDVPGKLALNAIMSSFDYVLRLHYNDKGLLRAGADPASFEYLARTRNDVAAGIIIPKVMAGKDNTDFNLAAFIQTINQLRQARPAAAKSA